MHLKFIPKGNWLSLIYYPLIVLAISGAIVVFINNYNTPWQHFTQQAQSFLKGRSDIPAPDHDFVYINGKYYWPEGPFPSVILMPFVAISPKAFHQGSLQAILIIITIILLYKLSRLKKFDLEDSIFLIAAFLLGSTISWLVMDPKSWFFAQVVDITFSLGLLFEFETRRRWWIIGICQGALLATRPTSGFIIFYLLYVLRIEHAGVRRKVKQGLLFLIPVGIAIFGIFWLDYSRYGNILDNGYGSNDVGGFLEPMRQMGVFSIRHIPTNIYYYFFESIRPVTKISAHLAFPFIKFDFWGLSFFLVAPIFIFAFKTIKKYPLLWGVIGLTLFSLLSYYAPGWYQYGPRYTADFMPLLFLLLLFALNGKLTPAQKLIISLSAFFNVYLLFTYQFFPLSS